ncbi:insulin-like growth factor-binding protein complex acid labile subunit [Lytechinus variegatus]|uniref:insulin-like growth factor-binding protein complex acid labile subunit n=1 Tax=Lytechinus variegatus TaxID=7654 RepID=UPI001BB2776B|nr:insulin-like growth factor-binding protein complex acid labile subunit [Lytechinus variegatus]
MSIPNGCKRVRNLSLRERLITDSELTPGTFVGFTFLTKLDLSHNQISKINANTFIGAPQLGSIDLMYNNINTFSEFALNGSENLQNIFLGRNYLIAVEETTFQQAPALRRIDLSWNHLASLRNTIFQHLWNLEYLDLHENKLINLPTDIFTDQSLLIFLDISNNLLSTLESNHFINLVELRKLDLSGNRLISIHGSIFSLPHIERLDLGENRLTHLGNETWLSHVELYLEGNPWVCDCSFQPFRSGCLWVSPFCNIIDSPVCTSPSDLTRHHMKGFINQTCHDLQNKVFMVRNLTDDKKPNNKNDSNYATGQDSNISVVPSSSYYMLLVLVPLCILFAYVYYSLRNLRKINHVVTIRSSNSEQPTLPLKEPAMKRHCDRGDSTPSKFSSQRPKPTARPSKKSNRRFCGIQLDLTKCKRNLNDSFNDSDC